MTSPLMPKPSIVQKLIRHTPKSKVHETAILLAMEFKRIMEQKTTPIDVQLNNAWRQLIEKNRAHLHAIVDAIITCGR